MMTKKSKHLLWTIVLLLLSTFSTFAQPIELKELVKKVDESLNAITTVVYKVDYFNKYLARKDTLYSTAICSLYLAPEDKMKSYHKIDLKFEMEKNGDNYFGQRRYNGDKVLWYSNLADSLTTDEKPEIYNDNEMKYAVVDNYSNYLLKKYFGEKNNFNVYGSLLIKIVIKDIQVTEEMLHNAPVYVLTITYKDKKDTTRDRVEKHYIRKTDFLPIAFYSFLRWENMEQYNYYEIDYIAINTAILPDHFKIEENERLNAVELYKHFQNQLKKRDDTTH